MARAMHLTRAVSGLRHNSISGCYFFAAFFFVPQVFFVLQPAMLRPPRRGFQCRTAPCSQHGYHIQTVGANCPP